MKIFKSICIYYTIDKNTDMVVFVSDHFGSSVSSSTCIGIGAFQNSTDN